MKKYILVLFALSIAAAVHSAPTGNAWFDSLYYSGSGNCIDCHSGLVDSKGADISVEMHWSTSMMANAVRDPYWRAKVASELHRTPGLADEINDKCSRCHAPMANDSAIKEGDLPLIFDAGVDPGFLNPASPYFDHAMDGVSCTLCHQIQDNGKLGTLEGVSGKFEVLDYLLAGINKIDRPLFGQYADPLTGPMRNNVGFTPTQGVHTSTSELCASCHDLKTPFVDADGNVASTTPESEFPEQMVYSEWSHSSYAQSGAGFRDCQSCHMPRLEESVKVSTRPGWLSPRPDFALHSMLGANTVMMDMLDRNRDALGVSATGFAEAIDRNRNFLQQAAGISVLSHVLDADARQLRLKVRVDNFTGHKFPSGYPSRRAYLHLLVKDQNGRIIFESGKLNADGSITGVALDSDSTSYEPHYDQIDDPSKVQVYEPIMQNTDGQVTHTLLRAASYIKDNRLLPTGFDKISAAPDVAVHGAAEADANFLGGGDELEYIVDLSSLTGPFTLDIQAELRYQPLSFGHLQDLFSDSSAVGQVSSFKTLFEDVATIRDELVSSASYTVAGDFTPPARYADVPATHWAYDEIEAISVAGITGGCAANLYCPDDMTSRGQMAVFIERGMRGEQFVPPAASGTLFDDVPGDYWSADWIEQLVTDGIASGCDPSNYCPDEVVTRAQMAIFLLRGRHGVAYVPPAATGARFDDVPQGFWAADWIEQLAAEGVTSGCDSSNYCPDAPVTRAEMAVFLAKTFLY